MKGLKKFRWVRGEKNGRAGLHPIVCQTGWSCRGGEKGRCSSRWGRERERKDGAEGTRVVYDSTRDQRRLCRPACAVWFIDRLDPTAAARRDPALVAQCPIRAPTGRWLTTRVKHLNPEFCGGKKFRLLPRRSYWINNSLSIVYVTIFFFFQTLEGKRF